MFRKFFVLLSLLTICVRLTAAVVDRSDKKAVVKAMFTAIAKNDCAAIWQFIPPAAKTAAIQESGSEAAAIKNLERYKVSVKDGEEIIANLENREFLDNLTAAVAENMFQIDGKWYIFIPEDKETPDLSTREKLAVQMMLAIASQDAGLFWQLLHPEEKIGMAEKYGSVPAAIKEIDKELPALSLPEKQNIVAQMSSPETVQNFVAAMGDSMVKVNDKWCADPKLYRDSFDRTDKEKVLKTYLIGVVGLDADAIWKTLHPVTRLKILEETENGDVQSAKKELVTAMRNEGVSELVEIKEKIDDPALIRAMLKVYGKYLVQINGNWYIDLEKAE